MHCRINLTSLLCSFSLLSCYHLSTVARRQCSKNMALQERGAERWRSRKGLRTSMADEATAEEAAITMLADDDILQIFRQLGAARSAPLACCFRRFAQIFADPLLWRYLIVAELALPPHVQLDGEARELYWLSGACACSCCLEPV